MNTLHYGDNLPILRNMPSESVDLIYLDPPFNSSRSYNVLFKDQSGAGSDAQITAFDDTWSWGPSAEQTYFDIIKANPGTVDDLLAALRSVIGENAMLAYLVMMAARLVELQRILKPTGSLYLHCDPTASHYLKIILDTVFGPENFINEIIWERSQTRSTISKSFRRSHDILLFYAKSGNYTYNLQYKELSDASQKLYENQDDKGKFQLVPVLVSGTRNGETGKPWHGIDPNKRGRAGMHWVTLPEKLDAYEKQGLIIWPNKENGMPRLKYYLEQSPGVPLNDNWYDIPLISSSGKESLGYPTQKPLALLERIIQASSNPGDLVLDPFCGCGTAIAAAEKLDRRWIGIDITYLAITLIEGRMKKMFPGIQFQVIGKPADLASAKDLALRDRYQFQWWALSLIGAKPLGSDHEGKGKKGSDKGIDGIINYIDSAKQELKRVLVQVKSGHVNSGTVRDLVGVLTREQAEIGVLVTLEHPSKDMITEASTAGYYTSTFWQKSYPRLQILTIEQLLAGAAIQMPPETGTFLAAQKVKKAQGEQGTLDI